MPDPKKQSKENRNNATLTCYADVHEDDDYDQYGTQTDATFTNELLNFWCFCQGNKGFLMKVWGFDSHSQKW